ncbi:MAG: Tfp pilus assembly protein FimT/FimU [Lachnospiraceae bacterium]
MKRVFKKNEKGFTLAELLIVVAIIAVLVAISIPIFTNKLEASREAVDVSNLRAAYALGQTEALTEQPASEQTVYYDAAAGGWATGKGTATTGKGTATTSGTVYDLPSICTYDKGDCTNKVIEVKYDSTGVTSCGFVDKN